MSLVFGRLKQEDWEFEASLGYGVRERGEGRGGETHRETDTLNDFPCYFTKSSHFLLSSIKSVALTPAAFLPRHL